MNTPEPWVTLINESEKRLQDEIVNSVKRLEDKVEETKKLVQDLVQRVEDRLTPTQIFLYKSNNQNRSELGPFMQVPFPNGSMPWGSRVATPNGEVVLPRVETVNDVRNLTLDELYGYCEGYYPETPVPGGQDLKERRIQLILAAIGYSN
ncbi:hypothetical protein VKT23_002878 [Stygiomarasmius scandens]|uniref:Mug135-like C-terminal domain-containing protein n=1 Tax=Marasmiellus scandens TaxID=2682957 RepID=A0ABR1K1W2_9AGAR